MEKEFVISDVRTESIDDLENPANSLIIIKKYINKNIYSP